MAGGDCDALSVRAAGGLKKCEMGALLSCFRSVPRVYCIVLLCSPINPPHTHLVALCVRFSKISPLRAREALYPLELCSGVPQQPADEAWSQTSTHDVQHCRVQCRIPKSLAV